MIGYGLRKRIFKTSYQRELDKIYRYHDGIIVRTKHPVDISDDKIVPMRSFDDMLNLEEELKTPIIANEISNSSTEFMIIKSGVVYRYVISDDSINRSIAASNITQHVMKRPVQQPQPLPRQHQAATTEPVRRHVRTTIKVEEPSIEDVMQELDNHRPHAKKK